MREATLTNKKTVNVNDLLYRNIFIVLVPEFNIYPDNDIVRYNRYNGKYKRRDLTRFMTVGWDVITIATKAIEGVPIQLDNRADVKRLYDILEQFINKTEVFSLLPNTTPKDAEAIKTVTEFAEIMFKHQKDRIVGTRIDLSTITTGLGLLDPTAAIEENKNKTTQTSVYKPKVDREIHVRVPSIF